MLKKGYFEDAFPLHDQSAELKKIYCSNEVYDILKLYKPLDAKSDSILSLYKKWAKYCEYK